MQQLVFATNNAHKLGELRRMLAGRYRVVGLADIGCHDDIPEDADVCEHGQYGVYPHLISGEVKEFL